MFTIVQAFFDAVDSIRNQTDQIKFQVAELAKTGDLILEVAVYPDGATFGQFIDGTYGPCWDGCNGITTVHRSGWCKVNQEHADFDCMCGISAEDEDEFYAYLDEQAEKDRAAEPMFEVVGSFVYDPNSEEPF